MRIRWLSKAVAAALGLGLLAAPSAVATAHRLTYYGGPVMHSEQVVIVVWGPDVNSTYVTQDPGLFQYLESQNGTNTDILGLLAQYGDNLGPGGAIENSANAVSYGGEYTITPTKGTGSVAATVTDADIQNQLQNSIASAALPAPLDNGLGTIYVVLFPEKDAISGPEGVGTSGQQFCAYHNTGGTTSSSLLYAVIPDNGSGGEDLFAGDQGCGQESSTLANETSALSHEFSETVNDPEVGFYTGNSIGAPIAWYENDDTGGEIADICDTGQASQNFTYANTWVVQKLWSNVDSACQASEPHYSAPNAGTISPPATVAAGQAASFSVTGASDPTADTLTLSGATLGPGIASYSWDWGDGSDDSTGATPQHTYAQGGQYTVTVTVTDDLGFTSTATTGITAYSGIPDVTTSTPATAIADNTATLPGTINPNGADTTYQFIYGLASNALSQSTASTDGGSGITVEDVNAELSNLTPGTTYYYELVGTVNSTPYDGGIESFTTTGQKPPPPAPIVSTGVASAITGARATLNGTVNADGLTVTHHFAWGTSASALTRLTPSVSGPTGVNAVPEQAVLSGLAPGTTYYFELQATGGGQTVAGQVHSLRTPALPALTTAAATKVTAKSATLHGTVNPHGVVARYYFQYGPTASYGHSTGVASAGSGTSAKAVTAALTGLKAKTKYHFRLVATGAGGTSHTADRTFTTTAAAAAPRLTFAIRQRPDTLGAIRVTFRCDEACSAGFTVRARGGSASGILEPTTLAAGTGRLRHAGIATVTLRRTVAGARLGRRADETGLSVLGAAWNRPGVTRRPVVRTLTLG